MTRLPGRFWPGRDCHTGKKEQYENVSIAHKRERTAWSGNDDGSEWEPKTSEPQ